MDPTVEYKLEANICQACGRGHATDCHEIARGPAREAARKDRCAWLALCRRCHDDMGEPVWPIARQLALKMICDWEHYDLVAVNRLRGRADDAITQVDVNKYLSVRRAYYD